MAVSFLTSMIQSRGDVHLHLHSTQQCLRVLNIWRPLDIFCLNYGPRESRQRKPEGMSYEVELIPRVTDKVPLLYGGLSTPTEGCPLADGLAEGIALVYIACL